MRNKFTLAIALSIIAALLSCGTCKDEATQIELQVYGDGFSTMYYGKQDVKLPDDLDFKAAAITARADSDKVRLFYTKMFVAGAVVPHGTAVLLIGKPDTTYTATLYSEEASDEVPEEPIYNMLHGYDEKHMTEGEGTFYKLTDIGNGQHFYKMNKEGGPFEISAHKAYLVIPDKNK